HFNDAPAEPPRLEQHDHSRVLPGDGHLNLTQWLKNLRAIGYDGWLSLELFNEKLWARDPLEVAKLGLQKMQSAVAQAGL
ncbi:MAG TPA: TIM barrel protein, partial [Planctomycetaceae bacterium]|nr:TIM barrel protein [Planctomycetaceae bacterium]